MATYNGYLTYLKTMLVEALNVTFDEAYPEEEWRGTAGADPTPGIYSSIEYPIEEAHYPGIWVDYDDVDPLQIAGVAHEEFIETDGGNHIPITRWKFSGFATYTITALSSLERDRIYDELVTVIAFGAQHPARYRFRQYIEDNPFIAANFNFDQIQPKGSVAAPGTPWGTDEIIYERSISMSVVGEFVPNPTTGELVPLDLIIITPMMVTDPADDGDLGLTPGTLITDWH